MKKFLALLLALVMVISLCACGSNEETKEDNGQAGVVENNQGSTNEGEKEEPTIVGKWSSELDFSNIMALVPGLDELDDDMKEIMMPKNLSMKINFEFKDSGTASISVEAKAAVEEYVEQVTSNLTDYLANALEDQGISVADFETLSGMSLEDYVSTMMDEQVGTMVEDLATQLDASNEGEYKFEGDKLYLGENGVFDDYLTIKLENNKFTVNGASTSDESVQFFIGLVFTRK